MTGAPSRSLLCPDLVGREALEAAVLDVIAQRDRLHVVALVGDAGLGKSALARATTERADRLVLTGRATPDGPALRPLAELAVGAVVAGADVADPAVQALRGGLAALLPDDRAASLEGTTFPLVAAEALLALVETIGAPVTLLLEDLHWADADTLDAIDRIADRVAARPLTLLLVTRPEGIAERLVRRLGARRTARVIDLQPLDHEGVEVMAARCLGAPAPRELVTLLRAAGGSPYLVEELLRTAVDVGALDEEDDGDAHGTRWHFDATTKVPPPSTLAESVAYRLAQLPPPTARALMVAAALGEATPVDAVLVAAARAGDEPLARSDLQRAGVDAQLLEPHADELRFRHALAAEAAAAGLDPDERRQVAAAALAALVALVGDDQPPAPSAPDIDPSVLAHLAELAGARDDAARWHLTAAGHHSASGATTAATTELERAAALVDDPALAARIRVELVEVLALAGRTGDAVEQARVAAALPHLPPHDRLRVDLALVRALPDGAERHAAMARALDAATGGPLDARAHALAALLAVDAGDHPLATEHANAALRSAGADAPVRCEAIEVLGRVARGIDLDQAHERFTEAAAIAEAHGLALWHARALHERATVLQLRDLDVSDLEAARAAAVRAGAPGLIATIDFHLAAVHGARFDGPAALTAARRYLDLASALANRGREAWGWLLVGLANVVSARWANAAPAFAEAARLGAGDAEVATLATFTAGGLAALLQDELAPATAAYQDALTTLSAHPGAPSPLPPWYLGPLLLTVAGDSRQGEWARRVADRSELQVAASVRGPWLIAEAVAAGRVGDRPRAVELVDAADVVWDGKPGLDAHRHLSRWLAAAPARAAGWGQPDAWLFEAESWAAASGFGAVADACRRELRAAGVAPRRRRGTTVVPPELERLGITGREVDVLRLVGAGLTNAAVADRLHVSAGTVKGYVSQLLAKTGAANRAGLARLAARHDLVDPSA